MANESDAYGIISLPSHYGVSATLDRLQASLTAHGMTIFARIDQQREAERVGLTLRPTQLLLFENPQAGTPLMQAAPSMALDLPLKVVAWEDAAGQVQVSYNDPHYLQVRHHLSDDLIQNISGIHALVDAARM